MHIAINLKDQFNQKLFELFKKNYLTDKEYSPEYQYKCVKSLDYWFTIYDNDDNIIASCSVIQENNNIYEINDVMVEEQFRGNNYSLLLIMNVLHYFEQNFSEKIYIKIMAELDNPAAFYSYKKIFGEPYRYYNKYAYFSYVL